MNPEAKSPLDPLPPPSIYEQEYVYWPWGELIAAVIDRVCSVAPLHGSVIDYMCGTGYLLHEVSLVRTDLKLMGCSLDAEYIAYGRNQYNGIELVVADALKFKPKEAVDVVICTGGIHHLRPQQRESFLRKVKRDVRLGGWFIVGEEVLSPFSDINSRRKSVLDLHYNLLKYSNVRNAPPELLTTGIDLLRADLLEIGEYKMTEAQLIELISSYFPVSAFERIWPSDGAEYGERLIVGGPTVE